jgi:hypothetical protein
MHTLHKSVQLLGAAMLVALSGGAVASTQAVTDMNIDGFSFTLLPPAISPGYYPAMAANKVVGSDTNLVAGSKNSIFQFDITLSFLGTHTEDWSAVAYTTGASSAFIDTTTNQFTINLATFMTDWAGPRCPPLSYPTCAGIPQNPAGNIVTGTWDPITHKYSVAWESYIPGHPFPDATGSWTISGTANPVPEPQQWVLMLAGIGMLGGLGLRNRRSVELSGKGRTL